MLKRKREMHYTERIGWLRASVMGANDGIISTTSLIIGVAAAQSSPKAILTAGIAGLVAGALSMAAGEYVSVSSQSDTEKADLKRESKEIEEDPKYELEELAEIYVERGLDKELAKEVATQLMNKDALAAHARDELGISKTIVAKPIQAAMASAASFSVGAILPIVMILISTTQALIPIVAATSLVCLGFLGAIAAHIGGADIKVGTIRLVFWGFLAMALTAAIGRLFGT